MAEKKCVMISSTARDLPEHRKAVMDACLRQSMFPEMMEHLPAKDADAIQASLDMIEKADIYLAIFAYRYGYVPKENNPQQISITEMEYNRAVQRGIPRLIFLMDKTHSITAADMDEDTKDPIEVARRKVKLEELKQRAGQERVANFFMSAENLRGLAINTLSFYRESDITQFHYISDIPTPPEAYIAHPYTLLQTHRLIGRQDELNLLTNWVTKKQEAIYWTRILNIVAIGGMGKSALTWKWFNDVAPQEMKPLAGRMWWSFYESDASFENFVIRAIAYVTRRPLEEVQKISSTDCETQLLAALDREPFLIVLDGLERILLAYARMDAARLNDGQVGFEKKLRKTSDPHVGSFLKKLAQVKNSRILVSSRLYPAELETDTGDPIPGSFRHDIGGLNDGDAIELWRAFDITGSRDELLPIFTKFDKHPLLIQALAGEVKGYRRAPGNFAEWRKANPKFDPTKCPHVQEAMGHVLEYILHGLDDKARKVLETIAAFRMPASYDTLAALFVGKGKLFPAEKGLDGALTELEDRGLFGWDKRANRYDLHPIVRGVVWSGLPDGIRNGVFTSLQSHFDSVPKIDEDDVSSLEDLTPTIELYNTLIGLGRYDDAYVVFQDRLAEVLLYKLSANRQAAELLEMFFPDGVGQLPRLHDVIAQKQVLGNLAITYRMSGWPKKAIPLYYQSNNLFKEMRKADSGLTLGNLAGALFVSGKLCESEAAARHSVLAVRSTWESEQKGINMGWWGQVLATIGKLDDAGAIQHKGQHLLKDSPMFHSAIIADRSQTAYWLGDFVTSCSLADSAWKLAQSARHQEVLIIGARMQGTAALGLGDFNKADERLHYALTRARAVNLVHEELTALVALAELRRRQGDFKAARELLDDLWEPAERGPFPLFHADAFNVLAQIERDAGNNAAAVEAATKAYRLAWCDGEPYAYHWGLVAARKHLKELSAPEPEMPPFDESKYETMPEVEINPNDEFHVDENDLGT
jgi:tetratricopeptide (TPR) repeat protein